MCIRDRYKHLWISREQNAEAPVFNATSLGKVDNLWNPNRSSEDYSPFAEKDQSSCHKGMPKSFFQICGMDPLRDDGLMYERVLRKNGVETRLEVYPGVPHAHFSFLPDLKISQKCSFDTLDGFGWLLGMRASKEDVMKVLVAPAGG